MRGRKRAQRPAMPAEYNMLLTATLCLLAFGIVMVFSASSTAQILSDGGLADSVHYLQRTLIFAAVGLMLMHLAARFGLGPIRRLTPLILVLTFVGLIAVLVAGTEAGGAGRWIGSGLVQMQPSEFAKLALILYGAAMLAERPRMTGSIGALAPYLIVVAAACVLVILQPDLGTIMVALFAVGATLVAAGVRFRHLGQLAALGGGAALIMALVEPYRRDRLIGFLNPETDLTGTGFQAMQAKIAMGSGGFTGVGIGDGVQKAHYLPEAHTDMIMAVIGEEIGLLGVFAVIGLFGMLGYAGFRIAQSAPDRYGALLATGLTSLILVQAVINMFAVMGLAPLTGVPLPFVSYGNNSLIVSLIAVGILLGISRSSVMSRARPRTGQRSAKLTKIGGRSDPAVHGRSNTKREQKAPGRSRGTASRGGGRRRDGRPRRAGPGGGGRTARPRR